MSNVTVQEALNSAILDLEHAEEHANCDYGNSISKCKAALSDIEKCEPVAYMNPNAKDTLSMLHWAKSEYYSQPLYAFQTISNVEPIVWMTNREDVIEQFGTMTITNAHKNSLVLAEQIIADLFDIPLYTSPQPRDWIVPSNEVIDTLWHKATYESVAHSEPFTRYRFSELLIKQLNTKG